MRAALALAYRAEGRAVPNPAVGCVIVNEGRLLGRGWTQNGGRPHAETVALAEAGKQAMAATAYVTLEPCAHHGKTPPCAEALIKSGISRIVIAIQDPDSRVAGRGIKMLKDAGLEVIANVLTAEAQYLLNGYFRLRLDGRPMITVKLATSLDGRVALGNGVSQWITSQASRQRVHLMRSRHDAVLTSGATALADNPTLTCRLPGLDEIQPLRVVVSSQQGIAADSNLAKTTHKGKVLQLYCHAGADAPDAPGGADAPDASGGADAPDASGGVEYVQVEADTNNKPDLGAVMRMLGGRGITSVMVESGGKFVASLMRAGLVDRLVWMRSPDIIGGDGLPAVDALGLKNLEDSRFFRRIGGNYVDTDTIEVFERLEGEGR